MANALTTDGSPYQRIADRNLFHLSAPVISVASPPIAPIALPKITLTGITTILGRRIAFVTVADTKPGQAAESWMLAEGQGINGIEMQSIDEKSGVVKIINHGELQVLGFDRDGVKPSTGSTGLIPAEGTFPPPAPPPVSAHKEAPLTAEEQVALIEIQRVKYQQENNPIRDILPPTEMTPETSGNR